MRAVLIDIEGTTTSLAFVRDTLFPLARAALPDYLRANADQACVRAAVAAARAEAASADPADTLQQWIDEDRKIAPLKELQGAIWREAYTDGRVRGHLWPDTAPGLRRMAAAGLRLAVFSSGSVEAQQLLFRHSIDGDLSPLFEAWFDTTTGSKREPLAYRAIARSLALAPQDILFLSDVPAELDAARTAGMRTCCVERGEAGDPPVHDHPGVASFDQLPGPLL